MSTMQPKLSRRDKIEEELTGCVNDHEKIRELLRRIDAKAPGLIPLTSEVRNFLLDLGQRYHRLRTEMAVSVMVRDGEFEAPTAGRGQRPLNELPLLVGLSDRDDGADRIDEVQARAKARTTNDDDDAVKRAFALSLERCADDTLRDLNDRNEQNVLLNGRCAHE